MVVNTSTITLKIDPTVILASMKNLDDLRKELNNKIDTTKTDLEKKINKVATDLGDIELTGNKVTIEDSDNNFESGTVEGALKELATKDKDLDKRIDTTNTNLTNKIETVEADLKQSVSSGKQLIATAVTGKDVPTNGSDSFQKMADNIDSIKTKLPILEGDVGVTEDSEGNVNGVGNIETRHDYPDKLDKVSQVRKYSISGSKNIVVADLQGSVYVKPTNYSKVIKLSALGEVMWGYSLDVGISSISSDIQGNAYLGLGNKVIKLSSLGKVMWEVSVVGTVVSISLDLQGNAYIGLSNKMTKLSSLGEVIWEVSLSFF